MQSTTVHLQKDIIMDTMGQSSFLFTLFLHLIYYYYLKIHILRPSTKYTKHAHLRSCRASTCRAWSRHWAPTDPAPGAAPAPLSPTSPAGTCDGLYWCCSLHTVALQVGILVGLSLLLKEMTKFNGSKKHC